MYVLLTTTNNILPFNQICADFYTVNEIGEARLSLQKFEEPKRLVFYR